MTTDRAALLGLPLVHAADAIADASSPALAEALLAWAELLVERLDSRNASALLRGAARMRRMERRQDITDRVVFHDPLSPY
jgi:thioredoxin-like negative regulator of GroEL